MILDDYILNLPKIGEGSYGEVYLTTKANSKATYATKKIDKQKITSEKLRQYFFQEIKILREVKHPNIMELVDIKSSHNNIYIITEYINGGTITENLTLYQKHFKKPFTEEIVIHLMKQIADAIHYLHEKRIIHRDLKLENILMHFDNIDDKKKMNIMNAKIKIIDFGFSSYLNDKDILTSIVGSPLNMAPDILHALTDTNWRKNLRYNEKADIYSIGVIMFYMLIGKPPFNAADYKDLYNKVNHGIFSIPKNLKLSWECIRLMNGMMMEDADKRFSIMEVLHSEFLMKSYKDFEIIDFSLLESNNNVMNGNNIKQNQNNIFLNIKEMINIENKKQQPEENEKMKNVLNDVYNNDRELEELLKEHRKEKKRENNINADQDQRFIHKPNSENNIRIEDQSNSQRNINIGMKNDFNNFNNQKQRTNSNIINLNNLNNNLINLDQFKNRESFDDSNVMKKTQNNFMNIKKDDYQDKNIFTVSMEKLDDLFEKFNKKFELFDIEAIPIYLENPQQYEHFIL